MPALDVRALAALVLATVTGCAAQDTPEVRAAPPTALDAPAPAPVSAPVEEREPEATRVADELGLADYERLLADNESRLRAAGVLLAVREERPVADERYAPPPPSGGAGGLSSKAKRVGDGDAGSVGGAKSVNDAGAGRSAETRPPSPSPSPRPTSKSTTRAPAKKDPPAAPAAAEPAELSESKDAAEGRCQTICDLSSATCDLQARICDLAARHTSDPRYGELCRRADDDCRVAADACLRCSP